MSIATMAWLALTAYALHIMEEFMFDWLNWARAVIKLPVEWNDFYITNGMVIVLGIVRAMLAPTLPLAPLIYASLMLINAVFFRILPVIRTKGRFSPVLFLPVASAVWLHAASEGSLNAVSAIVAILGGGLLVAYPIVMLHLKSRPYFCQDIV